MFEKNDFLAIACFILIIISSGANAYAQKPDNRQNTGNRTNQRTLNNANAKSANNLKPELGSDLDPDVDLNKFAENFDPMGWFWKVCKRHPRIVMIVIICGLGLGYLIYKFMYAGNMAPERVAKGRTANDEEIKEWQYKIESGMFYLGQNYPIGDYSTYKGEVGIPFKNRPQHIFVEAPTGSGKTTCFVVKQLVDDGRSRLVNTITFDRKGKEQFNKTSLIYKDLGHKVFYLSPWNPARSMGFEPLFGADELELRALVEGHIIISANPDDSKTHYRILEQEILEGVFKTLKRLALCQGPGESPRDNKGKIICRYKSDAEAKEREAVLAQEMKAEGHEMRPHQNVCLCRRRLATLPYAANIIQLGYKALRALVQHYPDIWAECPTLRPENPTPRTVEMLNGLKGKMRYYLDKGPKQVFSRSDFCLDELTYPDFVSSPQSSILYIDAPQEQGRASAVLSSVMSQLIYQKINERRSVMEERGISANRIKHLALWFDEIGTFTIPDVNNMLATMRDTNTGAILLLQDQKQLQLYYDRVVPDTIHSNSFCKVYTGTINEERARKLSMSIGSKIVSDKSYSYGAEGVMLPGELERKRSLRHAEVPILAQNEIEFMCRAERAPEGMETDVKYQEAHNLDGLAIISSDRPPFVIKKWSYFRRPKHQWLLNMVEASTAWNKNQERLIKLQDKNNQSRPVDEPNKLPEYQFSWEIVPKVYDALVKELSQNDEYIPVTSKQLKRINAKKRDLQMEDVDDFVNSICLNDPHINKSFNELSKRDGDRLLKLLDEQLEKLGFKKNDDNDNDSDSERDRPQSKIRTGGTSNGKSPAGKDVSTEDDEMETIIFKS